MTDTSTEEKGRYIHLPPIKVLPPRADPYRNEEKLAAVLAWMSEAIAPDVLGTIVAQALMQLGMLEPVADGQPFTAEEAGLMDLCEAIEAALDRRSTSLHH